jgi:hypothetical protein
MASEAEVLASAMSFPMNEVVERYAKEQSLPYDVACEHERELKRYLALCARDGAGYGMRGPIDELWHTFIVFTEKYAKFCQQVGGRFLHHSPNTSPNTSDSKARQQGASIGEGYVRFLEAYSSAYGESPPAHLWPRPMKHEDSTMSFEGCGCTTCSCVGGGCSCAIAIAERPEPRLPETPREPRPADVEEETRP